MRNTKWALALVATAAIGCGDSSEETTGDRFYGTIDATGLDTKFRPSSGRYNTQRVWVNGQAVNVYNFGTVAVESPAGRGNGVPLNAQGLPFLPADRAAAQDAYVFPDGCTETSYDSRRDAYLRNAQFAVFKQLPLPAATNAMPTMPLVRFRDWTGTGGVACNDIKSFKSLEEGAHGGQAAGDARLSLAPVTDPLASYTALSASFVHQTGWFEGLMLTYFDVGQVQVDGNGNVATMEGVLVNPPTVDADANDVATLVLQFRPGEAGYSGVVRLRNINAPNAGRADSFRSLCFTPPCAATAVNMTLPSTTLRNSGIAFIVGAP